MFHSWLAIIFVAVLSISSAGFSFADKRSSGLNALSSQVQSSSFSTLDSPAVTDTSALSSSSVSSSSSESSSTSSSPAGSSYFLIIDAGSTGSRIHIHSYIWSDSNLPIIEPSKHKKIKPGLSSFAKDPQSAVNPLKELIDFAKSIVPENLWSETPLHLQATAGLRSVTTEEANQILEVARKYFQQSPFKFQPEWALVISGRQEGINGWVATNYLAGTFHKALGSSSSSSSSSSVGVIEMGGSSTQITFVPSKSSAINQHHLITVSLAGLHYNIYTHSFLGYGQQAAQSEFQKKLISDIEDNGNSCYPKGIKHSANGDFKQCYSKLSESLFNKQVCQYSTCSFNNVFQPEINDESFYVIENFFYTLKFFSDQQNNKKSSSESQSQVEINELGVIDKLKYHGQIYCSETWESIKLNYNNPKSKDDELKQYCFAAAFQSAFLERGFGFNEKSKLEPKKKINGKDIDWEMGAALIAILNEKSDSSSIKNTFEEDPIMGTPLSSSSSASSSSLSSSASIVPLRMSYNGVKAWENESSCTTSNFLILAIAFIFLAMFWCYNLRLNSSVSSKKLHSIPCPPVIAQLQMRV